MSGSPQRSFSPRERFTPPPQEHDRSVATEERKPTTSLFIGNLPFHFRDQELRDICARYGEVVSAKVLMRNGVSKGSGFVEFYDLKSAEAAMDKLKNSEVIEGRKLRVDYDEGLENKRLRPRPDYGRGRPDFGRGRPPHEYRGGFGGGYRGGRRFSPYRGDYRGDYNRDYRSDRVYRRSRSPVRRSPPRRYSRSPPRRYSRSPPRRYNGARMPQRRYSRSPQRN